MARRRNSSTADGLMDLVALLPWWGGVASAAVSYWLLHAVATRPLPAAQTAKQVSDVLPTMLWQGLAAGGQYLIPFICLMGALASFLRRRKRNALFEIASQGSGADALQGMSWQEFEMLLGESFKRRGYGVRETGGGGADGGVDLVLTKGAEKFLVQCKQWKAIKVGVSTVRELYGVMAAEGASGGFVVTSGRFTKDAEAFASMQNIRLVNGEALVQLMRNARALQTATTTVSNTAAPSQQPSTPEQDPIFKSTAPPPPPSCPRCAKNMVQRTAKRGAMAGKTFWGCSAYSVGCRGTREI